MGGELSKQLGHISNNDPTLKELRLNGKYEDQLMDAKDIAKLSKAIAHCTKLETLWLKGQSLIQCQPLADALATNTSITHFCLEHCSLNGAQLASGIQRNCSLQHLSLLSILEGDSLVPVLNALQQQPTLRKLNLNGNTLGKELRTTEALVNLVRHAHALTHLHLDSCGLTDRPLLRLLAEVKSHPNLSVLSLNNNLRTEAELLAVANMLTRNQQLVKLELAQSFWRKTAPQFLRALAQNTSLTKLDHVADAMDPVAYARMQGFLLRNELKLPLAIPVDDELSKRLPCFAELGATQRRALAAARFLQAMWKQTIAADAPPTSTSPFQQDDLPRLRSDWEQTVAICADSASVEPALLLRLTLEDKELRFADFTHFTQLIALDLKSNVFSNDALLNLLPLRQLQTLSLRNCQLSSIAQTGIETLPRLHTMDLRDNKFPSLAVLLTELHGCNELTDLRIRHATASKSMTGTFSSFLPKTFADLRGLQTCDGRRNTECVRDNPLADKAIELLWKLGRVGANNLKRVNLTNKQLPRILLPSVLSALLYLDVCELDARGNEWCSEPSYQDSVILSMGPRFVWLDGEELTDFKRMQASRLDKNEGVRSNMGHFLTRRGGLAQMRCMWS
jgi:Ran GTPase-activating protein (RanGAP) involved in mRNA processing and transport